MSEQQGENAIPNLSRVCPLGRVCLKGKCLGRQVAEATIKSTTASREPEIVSWCGQEPRPYRARVIGQTIDYF